MAQPDIIKGTYLILAKGDGASPETFTALCGLDTKSFKGTINTTDQYTRDCADPEDVPVRRVIATGKAWTLTASGVLNRSNIAEIQGSLGIIGNYRFYWTEPSADLVFQGYWGGAFMLTDLEETGSDGTLANISTTFQSDGEVIFTQV